jgi:choloylglycine hydrolase
MHTRLLLLVGFLLLLTAPANACSILYYIDSASGRIYVVNNEDYWLDTKVTLHIEPRSKKELARLWYGWKGFAQGGVNEAGLFFDGAITPEQPAIPGYHPPKGNLGDRILAHCRTVNDALGWLDKEKVALTNGHLLFGDSTGNAAVVEWTAGRRTVIPIADNSLMATNFLLSDTAQGNYPCPRYAAMEQEIRRLVESGSPVGLREAGNAGAKAVQLPATDSEGHTGGTLYTTFIDLTGRQFVLVYKLDQSTMLKLDLKEEFARQKKRTIRLDRLPAAVKR